MQSVSTLPATQNLTLDNLVFDANGPLGHAVGSMVLPTTLFYQADGRVINSQLSKVSQNNLADAPESLRSPH